MPDPYVIAGHPDNCYLVFYRFQIGRCHYNLSMSAHQYDPHRHHRHTIRLPGWDYRTHALYFVTICTVNREMLFLTDDLAEIVAIMWPLIPQKPHARGVVLDEWILMPNHLHGLLLLPGPTPADERDAADPAIRPGMPFDLRYASQPDTPPASGDRPHLTSGSLGAVVGNFKSGVTRRINSLRRTPGHRVWQRGYYEHIVRDHHELERIRTYIRENPARWAEDRDNLDVLFEKMRYQEG